ncbi:MAG: hypothetical protein H7240_07060 [Glaciimonas sp.]|nr:hypothetical protein [Glaciimonas sp.]
MSGRKTVGLAAQKIAGGGCGIYWFDMGKETDINPVQALIVGCCRE